MQISDYILTEQEAQAYFSADENEGLNEPDQGPSWEGMWFSELESDRYPADLRPYGPEAYEAFWETWLAELQQPPPPDYYYSQNI